MLEWGHLRINNKSVCMNDVAWESTILLYAGIRPYENQSHISVQEWGTMRINNTSTYRNKVTREPITHYYAGIGYREK
jgi:hypothetical protein